MFKYYNYNKKFLTINFKISLRYYHFFKIKNHRILLLIILLKLN